MSPQVTEAAEQAIDRLLNRGETSVAEARDEALRAKGRLEPNILLQLAEDENEPSWWNEEEELEDNPYYVPITDGAVSAGVEALAALPRAQQWAFWVAQLPRRDRVSPLGKAVDIVARAVEVKLVHVIHAVAGQAQDYRIGRRAPGPLPPDKWAGQPASARYLDETLAGAHERDEFEEELRRAQPRGPVASLLRGVGGDLLASREARRGALGPMFASAAARRLPGRPPLARDPEGLRDLLREWATEHALTLGEFTAAAPRGKPSALEAARLEALRAAVADLVGKGVQQVVIADALGLSRQRVSELVRRARDNG